ncbi:MAG: YggS family pyridoxal phosphate-dependent enzyme [Gammaproteobacteria bacterium]|nr:MAG: YggS family pyridoxal phosphate-dependent enzyme [Gammaproteobacteria bacterium]RKZ94596.1 MAG: YggS family pyridoxal phosphate-dependent enzyme [Gammaproteobacteria bacterium]RKZ97633.1 MAG: YggS family pyridoxal phosphate-dependent enzyme [Gammaproteobacteria bacterium]RLA00137.1 MAG: YggS family pyridoxal phosphate-dependent enzyme [Gammaproteobacteria bacterium]
MTDIKKRLFVTDSNIKKAEIAFKRQTGSVQLLAVSKTWSSEVLRDAAMAGQRLFGENYLQEALVKIDDLADLNLEWHFIGPIQSNKTKDIASHFDWVQSIDRLKIAQRLSNQRPSELADLNICIQVNIDNETTKSGVAMEDLLAFAEQINKLERLSLRGLMIIPAKTDDPEQQRTSFKKAYQLYTQLTDLYPTVDTLSMGMTADMTMAIAEGSTMVRIGTAVFGQRHTATGQVN